MFILQAPKESSKELINEVGPIVSNSSWLQKSPWISTRVPLMSVPVRHAHTKELSEIEQKKKVGKKREQEKKTFSQGTGARFSKVPGDIILFVSWKQRRSKTRNFAVILIFLPITSCEMSSFTEQAGRSFTDGFSDQKSFRDCRETGPRAGSVLFLRAPFHHCVPVFSYICSKSLPHPTPLALEPLFSTKKTSILIITETNLMALA